MADELSVEKLRKVASGVYLNWFGETLGENATRADIEAIVIAILAAIRESHAIVPREATEGMVILGYGERGNLHPADIYRAMIAAYEAGGAGGGA